MHPLYRPLSRPVSPSFGYAKPTVLLCSIASMLLSGCAMGNLATSVSKTGPGSLRLSGSVHGGQQPVSGAHVYLYAAASTPAGPALSQLNTSNGYVTTDDKGNWAITGDYSCPTGAYVYLLALGGNPGLSAGTNNSRLALAAGLGACSALAPGQSYSIDEVTTAVTASALASIATTEVNVGSATPNQIIDAFQTITIDSDPHAGLARAATPDGTGTVPQARIDSLANSLATCVNSDGTGAPCAALMTAAGVTGSGDTPIDTFQAALQIAQNPTVNVDNIFMLADANAPFQPQLSSAPSDWTLAPTYSGGGAAGTSTGLILSPASATLQQGSQVVLTATPSSSAASYSWSTTAQAGAFSSGQSSFCSTAAQATYISNASPALSMSVTDTVSIQAYASVDCSGSSSASRVAAITTVPPASASTASGVPTKNFTATVVLPSGSTLTPDALTVLDSVTQTTPAASGTFTLPAYDNGEQIVFVDSPDGTPMMMSWMDANHTTVSASTTAEVLAYMALGGSSTLSEANRETLIAQIPQLSSFPALVNAVSAELAANADAFASQDAAVAAALNQLFTATTGVTPFVHPVGVHPLDVTINPDQNTPQSGISISSTAPSTYTDPLTPWATFITNTYRRRAHVFINKQKDTLNGTDTAVGSQLTDFDLSATTGFNGGVTGALTDIIKAYFGNQPTAYAPSTADPVDLPVDSGFDSTTYQVIAVGPGGSGNPSPIQLTTAQQTILFTTSVNSFVSDFLVPFVNNVLVGTNEAGDANLNTPLSGSANSTFVLSLEKNIANIVNQLPGEQDKLVAGDYKGAITDLLYNAGTQPLVADAISAALQSAAPSVADAQYADASLKKFNQIMYGAGAGLQVFDSVVYLTQLTNSDNVDVWYVKSTPFTAKLTPPTTTLSGVGSVGLAATVLNTNSTTVLSYKFTLVPATGQQPIGTLTGSSGTVPDSNGGLSFCTSNPNVAYSNNSSTVASLKASATDTITVTAFSGGNCIAANQFSTTASATIITNPNGAIVVTPPSQTINPGDTVTLNATYSDPTDNPRITPGSWQWLLNSGSGSTVGGTLSNSDGTASSAGAHFCSTQPHATYSSTTTYPLTASVEDTVVVLAYTDTACTAADLLPFRVTASVGYSTITTSGSPRFWVQSSSTIHPGDNQPLTAAFRLGLQNNNTPTPHSILWTTSGTYGSLTVLDANQNPVTGQTSYCSPYAQSTYVATPNPSLGQAEADTVTATPYDDTACTAAQVDGLTGSAAMNIVPPPGPFIAPAMISSVLQSGDGNFYAAANGTCAANTSSGCSYILRIDSAGSITTLHTFEVDESGREPYTNLDGQDITNLLEGQDGNLYGTTGVGGDGGGGTIFKLAKDGTYTVLYSFPITYVTTAGLARGGACCFPASSTTVQYASGDAPFTFLQAADGNFYGIAAGGLAGISPGNGVFFSLSSAGTYTPLATYFYPNTSIYFRGTSTTQITQGLDGNFYGIQSDPISNYSSQYSHVFRLDEDGNATVLFQPATNNSQGLLAYTQFAPGSDGTFYGNLYDGPNPYFSLTEAGSLTTLSSEPAPLYGILGGDTNYYSVTASANIQQTSPSGQVTNLGPVSDPDTSAALIGGTITSNNILASNGKIVGGAYNSTSNGLVYYLFDNATAGSAVAPVKLSFASSTAAVNKPITLTWSVSNAYSLTAQQCHATVQNAPSGSVSPAGNWSGPQTGTLTGSIFSGSASIVPTAPGTYTYALTCGGIESGFATLTVQ